MNDYNFVLLMQIKPGNIYRSKRLFRGSIREYIGRLSYIVTFVIFIDVDMIQSVRCKLEGNYFGNYIEWESLKEIALYA